MILKTNIKNFFSVSNILFFTVIGFLVYSKYPQIKQNFISQGELISDSFLLSEVRTSEPIQFPRLQKQVVVFWATWCGPCKIELARLQKLVESKKITPQQVLAVSLDDNESIVLDYLKENNYEFLVAFDKQSLLAQKFNIKGTPTILFVDEKNEVKWRTTGVSVSLGLRAENFLN